MPQTSKKASVRLRPDPRNARLHTPKNKDLIRKSLQEVGGFRSIAADGDGIIRAGNGVYEQATKMGMRIRVVDSTAGELIVVRRKDLKGKRAERAALLDNRTAETSEWDAGILEEMQRQDASLLEGIFDQEEISPKNDYSGVQQRALKPAPQMTWVLIGIPTVRFSEITNTIDALSSDEQIFVEVSATDAD